MKIERIEIAGSRGSAVPGSLEFEGGAIAILGPGDRGGAAASIPSHPPTTRLRSTRRPVHPGGHRSREVPMKIERIEIAGFRCFADPASLAPGSLGLRGAAAAIVGPGDRGGAAASIPNHPPATRFRQTSRPVLPAGRRSREVPMESGRIETAGFRSSVDPVSLEYRGGAAAVVGSGGCGRSGSVETGPPFRAPVPGQRRGGGRCRGCRVKSR